VFGRRQQPVAPGAQKRALGEVGDSRSFPGPNHLAKRRLAHPGQQLEQDAFARTGRPRDHGRLARRERGGHVAQQNALLRFGRHQEGNITEFKHALQSGRCPARAQASEEEWETRGREEGETGLCLSLSLPCVCSLLRCFLLVMAAAPPGAAVIRQPVEAINHRRGFHQPQAHGHQLPQGKLGEQKPGASAHQSRLGGVLPDACPRFSHRFLATAAARRLFVFVHTA